MNQILLHHRHTFDPLSMTPQSVYTFHYIFLVKHFSMLLASFYYLLLLQKRKKKTINKWWKNWIFTKFGLKKVPFDKLDVYPQPATFIEMCSRFSFQNWFVSANGKQIALIHLVISTLRFNKINAISCWWFTEFAM